jgi:tRNA pseudouridine38-40 synthase
MRNIKLLLAYDGTEYHGWQRQTGVRTVQETLEEAVAAATGQPSHVHALGQVAHFHTECDLDVATLKNALNAHLPSAVVVRAAEEMPHDFHANFHVRSKRYRYVIHDGPAADPFVRRYAFHSKFRLDAECMHAAAQCLRGTHEFHSFETEWPNRSSSVRTITRIVVRRSAGWRLFDSEPFDDVECRDEAGSTRGNSVGSSVGEFVCLEVEADGFLYNMVRAIAGTLYNVGRGFWPPEEVASILTAEDRRRAGPTAPPQGLFLVSVEY